MKSALHVAGAIALLSVAVFFGVLAWTAHEIPAQVDRFRQAAAAQITAARGEAFGQIEEARRDVLVRTDRQLTALRGDVMARVDHSLSIADRRIGDSLARVDGIVTIAADLRDSLKPTLANTAALTKDLQDSWDDLYFDVKASIGSATVAARGIAEASEAVGKAAPALSLAATTTTQQFAGITTDVHTFTSKFTAPRTKKQKLWDGIKTGAFIGARIIP